MQFFRVYGAVLRMGLSGAMEYRFNYCINTVAQVLIFSSVQMYMWYAIFGSSGTKQVAGMDLSSMFVYLACSVMCYTLTRLSNQEREQATIIRTGRLNSFLVRPISHGLYAVTMAISERISQALFVLIPFLCIVVPLSIKLHLPLSVEGTLLAIPILLMGTLINLLLGLSISYLAFWLDEVWTFHAIKDISLSLLSGMVFPLSALPEPWRGVSAMLPFQFMAYVPAGLMNGTIPVSAAPGFIGLAIMWVFIVVLVVRTIWYAGLKRYSAFGG